MVTIDLKRLLGLAIKTHRHSLGISQEELAYRAGLHRTYLSDVERGVRNPSIDSIEKVARALEVPLANLFEPGNGAQQTLEILLVEDNPHDVDLAKRAFKKANMTNPLHIVHDGAEALDFIFARGAYASRTGQRPQVVLLDLNLRKISGLEVLRRLKNDERTRNIPVVVLTVSDHTRDITECRRLGVISYIVKPMEFQSFSEATAGLNLAWTLVRPSRAAAGRSMAEER